MLIYPGSWGGSRIDSVAIFIRGSETDAPQTDRLTDRSEVVCTINCWKQKQRFFKQAATPLWFICIFMRVKTFFLLLLFLCCLQEGVWEVCEGYLLPVTSCEVFNYFILIFPLEWPKIARRGLSSPTADTRQGAALSMRCLSLILFSKRVHEALFKQYRQQKGRKHTHTHTHTHWNPFHSFTHTIRLFSNNPIFKNISWAILTQASKNL